MSSFLNKIANSVTNSAGNIIGRENLNKLANTLNKTLVNPKYRDYLITGNVVQLISKSSCMPLHICSSQNDPSRLIILGNGQVGMEFGNGHFLIEVDPKNGHYKFKNAVNYICVDNKIPCVLSEPAKKPKHKHEYIRARNEFRVHEVLGSEDYFALESVYSPGNYLSVLPDGSIGVNKNKTDENTHFCIHVIYAPYTNLNNQLPRPHTMISSSDSRPQSVLQVETPAQPLENPRASAPVPPSTSDNNTEQAPSYSSLFPQLPK